ncbi:MAG TPA: L,D-transpeptidase family protein [Xanthobacteraceae bacterium]
MHPKHRRSPRPYLAAAVLAALITAAAHAAPTSARNGRSVESIESRSPGEPIMAIVSLREQRITIYDAKGWILRAPVSSGQKGRETPAGVFSVIQKDADHHSNLYDDAWMPHMQRITWSGIALHGGPLPGYAASHGCVRMPFDFAARLFDLTRLGMRVIVAPSEVAPVEIVHPALFPSKPGAAALAAARAAEADEAARKADQARLVAVTASREAARAMMGVRVLENLKRRAEEQLAAAEAALGSAPSAATKVEADDAKAKALARIAELEAQWAAARDEVQPKLDAVGPAREAAVAAEAARVAAAEAARELARELDPVSVFVSRKTQRFYVRRAFQPILESPVTIIDPDRPIGTHVFTAMAAAGGGADLRWSVVSLKGGLSPGEGGEPQALTNGGGAHAAEPSTPEPGGAKAALDRIVIPQDIVEQVAGMASPRSSLIVSDEELSPETANDTDFVVVLSDEPQGGIAIRRRGLPAEVRSERPRGRFPYWRSPSARP